MVNVIVNLATEYLKYWQKNYGVPTPPKFKLCPLFAHTIIHWQHSNIQLKHTNLHLQHSCQAFKMHSQQSNITPNIQSIKWNIQSRHAKFTYNIRTCTLNKRLFNSNSHLGHSTFNSTFHSNIRLVNWNIQYEYSIQTFNWNIRFENPTFYSRFNSNIRLINSNIQSKHSIARFRCIQILTWLRGLGE